MFAEAAPNAMMIVGADGRITLVNAQAEKLFGYDRRELLSQSIDILVPERYRANHSRQASAFFSGTSTRAMGAGRHLFGLRKDGSEVPIEIGLNPITTTDGELAVVASIIDVTERLKAQQLLEQSLAEKTALLAEKTTLLKEVHHRVKNNLQVICSLLSMQISSSDSDASRLLNDAYSRVLTMSLIHEQVFQSDTLAHLNFGEYVELLSARLFSAYCIDPSRIRVELNVEAIRFAMDDAIPCGLILNELLTNALKHAFNDGRQGLIRIDLRETKPGHAELAVADNGMGLPPGFRLEESRSHGLQVVRTLIQQLQADLVVIVDGGTTFRFGWKLSEAEALPH
jgi:PAS domain S-box-containing protein